MGPLAICTKETDRQRDRQTGMQTETRTDRERESLKTMVLRLNVAIGISLLLLGAVRCCTKEEYTARFGVEPTYKLLHAGSMAPYMQGDELVAHVSYQSTCKGGGSEFTTETELKTGMPVVIAKRHEPVCDGSDVLAFPQVKKKKKIKIFVFYFWGEGDLVVT